MRKEKYPHEQFMEWVDNHLIALLITLTALIIYVGFDIWVSKFMVQPYGCCEIGVRP